MLGLKAVLFSGRPDRAGRFDMRGANSGRAGAESQIGRRKRRTYGRRLGCVFFRSEKVLPCRDHLHGWRHGLRGTFVGIPRHHGGVYRASGWIRVVPVVPAIIIA